MIGPDDDRHGTKAGYEAHKHGGPPPCDRCREANRLYMARRRAESTRLRELDRWRNRTYYRAVTLLLHSHPVEFGRLLDAVRAETPPPVAEVVERSG